MEVFKKLPMWMKYSQCVEYKSSTSNQITPNYSLRISLNREIDNLSDISNIPICSWLQKPLINWRNLQFGNLRIFEITRRYMHFFSVVSYSHKRNFCLIVGKIFPLIKRTTIVTPSIHCGKIEIFLWYTFRFSKIFNALKMSKLK